MENLLNLALEAGVEERSRSEELNVGYDEEEKSWEVIIKYSGQTEKIAELAETVTVLLNGYAVIRISESRLELLSALPEVEFIEKPKSLYFEADIGRQVSCIDAAARPPLSLDGEGVLIGIVDSGIDYEHPDFRNEDGTTRIVSIWDQTVSGQPPQGYASGTEFSEEQINEALAVQDRAERFRIVPSRDESGHGTAVAGIAAGNGRGSAGNRYRGVAVRSRLVVVRMGRVKKGGFPRTTELMTGVDYIIRKAKELKLPVAVNISFGNTYGSHEPYN